MPDYQSGAGEDLGKGLARSINIAANAASVGGLRDVLKSSNELFQHVKRIEQRECSFANFGRRVTDCQQIFERVISFLIHDATAFLHSPPTAMKDEDPSDILHAYLSVVFEAAQHAGNVFPRTILSFLISQVVFQIKATGGKGERLQTLTSGRKFNVQRSLPRCSSYHEVTSKLLSNSHRLIVHCYDALNGVAHPLLNFNLRLLFIKVFRELFSRSSSGATPESIVVKLRQSNILYSDHLEERPEPFEVLKCSSVEIGELMETLSAHFDNKTVERFFEVQGVYPKYGLVRLLPNSEELLTQSIAAVNEFTISSLLSIELVVRNTVEAAKSLTRLWLQEPVLPAVSALEERRAIITDLDALLEPLSEHWGLHEWRYRGAPLLFGALVGVPSLCRLDSEVQAAVLGSAGRGVTPGKALAAAPLFFATLTLLQKARDVESVVLYKGAIDIWFNKISTGLRECEASAVVPEVSVPGETESCGGFFDVDSLSWICEAPKMPKGNSDTTFCDNLICLHDCLMVAATQVMKRVEIEPISRPATGVLWDGASLSPSARSVEDSEGEIVPNSRVLDVTVHLGLRCLMFVDELGAETSFTKILTERIWKSILTVSKEYGKGVISELVRSDRLSYLPVINGILHGREPWTVSPGPLYELLLWPSVSCTALNTDEFCHWLELTDMLPLETRQFVGRAVLCCIHDAPDSVRGMEPPEDGESYCFALTRFLLRCLLPQGIFGVEEERENDLVRDDLDLLSRWWRTLVESAMGLVLVSIVDGDLDIATAALSHTAEFVREVGGLLVEAFEAAGAQEFPLQLMGLPSLRLVASYSEGLFELLIEGTRSAILHDVNISKFYAERAIEPQNYSLKAKWEGGTCGDSSCLCTGRQTKEAQIEVLVSHYLGILQGTVEDLFSLAGMTDGGGLQRIVFVLRRVIRRLGSLEKEGGYEVAIRSVRKALFDLLEAFHDHVGRNFKRTGGPALLWQVTDILLVLRENNVRGVFCEETFLSACTDVAGWGRRLLSRENQMESIMRSAMLFWPPFGENVTSLGAREAGDYASDCIKEVIKLNLASRGRSCSTARGHPMADSTVRLQRILSIILHLVEFDCPSIDMEQLESVVRLNHRAIMEFADKVSADRQGLVKRTEEDGAQVLIELAAGYETLKRRYCNKVGLHPEWAELRY